MTAWISRRVVAYNIHTLINAKASLTYLTSTTSDTINDGRITARTVNTANTSLTTDRISRRRVTDHTRTIAHTRASFT